MAKQKKAANSWGAPALGTKYVPGVCNIDAGGRRKRALFGLVMLAITIALWYYFKFVLAADFIFKTMLFIPALLSFIGLWQAQQHFCMGNAKKRSYEIGGVVGAVSDEASILKDKQKTEQIFFDAIVSALVLTLILMFF